jgi:hypothetical protein
VGPPRLLGFVACRRRTEVGLRAKSQHGMAGEARLGFEGRVEHVYNQMDKNQAGVSYVNFLR